MQWTRLAIRQGSGARNDVALAQLRERFWNWYAPQAVQRSHGRGSLPQAVAMFSLRDPVTNDVVVYFTPNAAAFVAQIDGVEACAAPVNGEHLELSVGDHAAWEIVADSDTPLPQPGA